MAEASHDRWERAVEACVDGALSPEQDEAVRRHLADCPDCSDGVEFLLALQASLIRLVAFLPPLSTRRLVRLADRFSESIGSR